MCLVSIETVVVFFPFFLSFNRLVLLPNLMKVMRSLVPSGGCALRELGL